MESRSSWSRSLMRGLLGTVIGLIGLQPTYAATRVLTLDEAVRLVAENSEDLQLKKEEIDKRENQYDEALGTALPQISAEATFQRYFKEPVFFGNRIPIQDQVQSSLTLSQTVWAFGRVSGAIKAADAGIKIGKLGKKLTEVELEYMARVSYHGALLASQQLEISKQTLENAKENLAILKRKFRGGRPPQSDLLRLQSDIAARTPQVKAAESQYQQALMTLAQLCGINDSYTIKLENVHENQLGPLDKQVLQTRLMSDEQPQIQMLKESIKFNEQIAKVQKAGSLPTLNLFGGYTYSGASATDINGRDLNDSAYAGLILKWNLWDGGATNARYRQAVNDKNFAQINLVKSKENLQLNLNKSLSFYHSLVESLPTVREAVSLAEKSFKISQRRFSTGQASITEVNNNEAALTQVRLSLANTIFEIHRTRADIEKILAGRVGR